MALVHFSQTTNSQLSTPTELLVLNTVFRSSLELTLESFLWVWFFYFRNDENVSLWFSPWTSLNSTQSYFSYNSACQGRSLCMRLETLYCISKLCIRWYFNSCLTTEFTCFSAPWIYNVTGKIFIPNQFNFSILALKSRNH